MLEVVGRGGMGTVYRAMQLSLQREVAVKVLARKYSRDTNFRELFINEARAAAQLIHPNIVQVYDAGTEGDVSYFSMEFISQGSVEEILEVEKKIPWKDAILMVLEAAHGLEYAEGKHIVHRDIKPDNLMLNADGRIKIADLGLAKQGEGGKDQGIIGTPHFIPPEQALGKSVDSRADIYSLGATFFRMITGKTLFTGKTAKEIVLKHINEPAPAASSVVSDVPDELDAVMAKMLAKAPDKRYASATDLVHALETVCAHHGIKGAIIKKGISKRVLVPLLILLIGASAALIYLSTREEKFKKDEKSIQAAKDAELRAAEAKRKREAAERSQRITEIKSAWGALKLLYAEAGGDKGVRSHRDEKEGAEQREAMYRGLAKKFDDFAAKEDVVKYDSELGFVKLATDKATAIRKEIDDVKKTDVDKQQKIAAKVKEAEQLRDKLKIELQGYLQAQQFSLAYKKADELSREKPLKDDPFEKLLDWEWVSPINPAITQSARDTKRITNVITGARGVTGAREYFGDQKKLIPGFAKAAWTAIEKQVPKRDAIPDTSDENLEKAKGLLQPVIDNFGDTETTIKDCTTAARSRIRLIEAELAKRARTRVLDDRAAVRKKLRENRSLDPGVLPNNVMMGDFADAKTAWRDLLDNKSVKTPAYVAFVRERIEALRYIEYLFAQFRVDVTQTVALRSGKTAPLRSLACQFQGVNERRPFKFNLDKPDEDSPAPGIFFMSKRFKGKDSLRYGTFGMDWVYHSIFRVPGGDPNELRWREPTPVVRFALALFCFETMQYQESLELFRALRDDATYGAAAQAFAARAETEAAARAEYERLLMASRTAKTSEEIKKVMQDLSAFSKTYAKTLFYVDVMPSAQPLGDDIVAAVGKLAIPALQPAPEPPK
ncbi:MAG: serine/threonine-protein kinase [Planctomycetota bacterium]|jgi:hypothetical protein